VCITFVEFGLVLFCCLLGVQRTAAAAAVCVVWQVNNRTSTHRLSETILASPWHAYALWSFQTLPPDSLPQLCSSNIHTCDKPRLPACVNHMQLMPAAPWVSSWPGCGPTQRPPQQHSAAPRSRCTAYWLASSSRLLLLLLMVMVMAALMRQ
jgi:hypothetical protein